MKLAVVIALAWTVLDLTVGKTVLGVLLPIYADTWNQIAHALTAATH